MKKTFLVFLAVASLCVWSCNSKDDKDKDKDDKVKVEKEKDDPENEVKDDNTSSGTAKAANELCDCFNENVSDVDPAMKKIIIKASNSSNPVTAMQNELMKIEDEQERTELAQDFQKWSENKEMEDCGNKIKKKYKLKDNDPKVQKAMLVALEDNGDCTLLAAMLKMAMKMKGDNQIEDETERE